MRHLGHTGLKVQGVQPLHRVLSTPLLMVESTRGEDGVGGKACCRTEANKGCRVASIPLLLGSGWGAS